MPLVGLAWIYDPPPASCNPWIFRVAHILHVQLVGLVPYDYGAIGNKYRTATWDWGKPTCMALRREDDIAGSCHAFASETTIVAELDL